MYLKINGGFKVKKWQTRAIHLTGFILLMSYILLSHMNMVYRYYVVAVAIPCWMYSVWSIMPRVDLSHWLTDCTFPLFVMHQLFIALVAIVTHGFLSKSACEASIASTALLFAIVTGTCFAVSYFTHKFKLLALILWGGR